MKAPQTIIELVERFERNIESYKSGVYNETQVRREFIDPFFETLGWDVSNKSGYAEAYKDVVHEYSQKTADTTEAPDYLFRIGNTKKFFVEAKKPSVNLAGDISPAFQLRRYAWTAKLPLSILTDFEEFVVYDCRVKPNKNDKASFARINYLNYKDYIEKWDEIESVFSKDAILKGSFDKYAESNKSKKGTAEVDDVFLKEIEHWRELLAKNIALRNPKLTNRELNFAVQKNIDRIIFLRICEDRGIEEYGQLMALQNGTNVYPRLLQIFTRADEKYNSGLFHFEDEKGRNEPPDTITPKIKIDDKTLKDIFNNLYYPESPYEFSVLPADILGHVYEQFLGKVIRLTESHQAKIDEKPEVKKAGGVYYTPTYIVDYIVKNTVGKKLEGKTPKEISKLKILDPACGSGSFLLGAYQYLLDWHLQFYIKTLVETTPPNSRASGPVVSNGSVISSDSVVSSGSVVSKKRETMHRIVSTKGSPIYRAVNGEWRLATAERKRILLNNIFGVDIDAQAVEVTKLSLLLKVLEGETEETLSSQLKMFRERALPDLSNNIKCGNSLIGPDFYNQTSLSFARRGTEGEVMLDDNERIRINAFDWNEEFKNIFKKGSPASSEQGFDVVIGNPPYVRSQMIETKIKNYYTKSFEAAVYQPDTFAFFIEKAIKLLNESGYMSFIVPNGILTNNYYSRLRKYILDNTAIKIIVDLKSGVFQNASVDTSIFVLERKANENYEKENQVKIGESNSQRKNEVNTPTNMIHQKSILNLEGFVFNTSLDNKGIALTNKISSTKQRLGELFEIKAGMKVRKEFIAKKKQDSRFKKFLLGSSIKPYKIDWQNYWVCYDKEFENKFTNQAFRDESIFLTVEKILVRQVMGKERIYATLDSEQYYVDQTIYILLNKSIVVNSKLILGIINSKLMTYYFSKTLSDRKETFPKIKGVQLASLPIPIIKNSLSKKNNSITSIISHVTDILIAHKKLKINSTPQEKEVLQRQIDALDKQIDKLVYELYGLTDEEIAIVEGS